MCLHVDLHVDVIWLFFVVTEIFISVLYLQLYTFMKPNYLFILLHVTLKELFTLLLNLRNMCLHVYVDVIGLFFILTRSADHDLSPAL